MNTKILIVGRTGTGKDVTAKILSENGYKQLISYTTREPRYEGEDTHLFIKPEEVSNYEDQMIAYTKIGDVEYFGTIDQLENSDVYIIDPNGINALIKICKEKGKDFNFRILYLVTNRDVQKERVTKRGDKQDVFNNRVKDENNQFLIFETELVKNNYAYHNIPVVIINNNGNIDELTNIIKYLIFKN